MARGRKTGGRDFRPGVSGNPGGRKPMSPEMKAVRKLTPSYIQTLISRFLRMSREEFQRYLSFGDPNIAEIAVSAIIAKAISEGDYMRLDFLLDRVIGRVIDQPTQMQSVRYRTTVRPDGTLIREVVEEEFSGLNVR